MKLRTDMKIETAIDKIIAQARLYRKKSSYIERLKVAGRPVIKYFKRTPIKKITLDGVQEYMNYRSESGISKSTLNKEILLLKQITGFSEIKTIKVKNKRITYFNPGQIKSILKACDEMVKYDWSKYQHIRDMAELSLETGMRLGEITGLTWDRVYFESGRIYLEESKGGGDEWVFLTDRVLALLKEIKMRHPTKRGAVILYCGRPVKSIKNGLKTIFDHAGLRGDFSFHTFRHTFITNMVKDGLNPEYVKQLARHKQYSTTELYIHLFDDDLRDAVNRRNNKALPGLVEGCQKF